ncbi:MAG: glycosyltransferase family 4 protein, partial [Bacteroidia bacterium]|nr:glycosyltransferase family 4 protein [Bacteroidia bacterium]
DAKRYFHNRTGLGNYSRDLVNNLVKQHPEDRFFLFDKSPEIDGLDRHVIAVPPSDIARFFGNLLWRPFYIRKDMAKYKLDLFHGLSNELPFGKFNANIKKVVTIHDVIFDVYPNHYSWIDRQIYRKKTAHAVEVADSIIVTSQATANDLIHYYKFDVNKIQVVYQTCGEAHRQSYSDYEVEQFKVLYHLPDSFFLYLSSFQTRKNHLQLLNAYKYYQGDFKLVLAGKPGETLEACKRFINLNGLDQKVLILDTIQTHQLPLLYRSAKAFVYPSLIEGFGIPLLEAAEAGLPIAVNDIPIFRELAPEGSLYFNANDTHQFAQVLDILSTSSPSNYSNYLERFNPIQTTQQVYNLYKSLLS